MSKRSINLVLPLKPEPPLLKKMRLYLPIASGVITFIFVIIFISTLIFLRIRNDQYESMLAQSQLLESQITAQKEEEGLYVLTYRMLGTIEKILSKTTTFSKLTSDISVFNSTPLILTGFSLSSKGDANLTIHADNADALSQLIDILSKADDEKKYANIIASNVIRNEEGLYTVTLTFKPNPDLLK
ncbi:hypothetical protein A3D77_02855 [Candidatus Gottesmanbacteria bacterium RIFCSPHIGHO2_02_FULL_39_11]|uniref:PilN domain-containing protein n=1 Tax=Candidatus Gottesmanbacteria bacterium RIFCSPHIGHO2_02_FULL_39_11 TaxID=1798382 RepID=A0A1F5ZT08_9BACT|nr:MAG: hypothetical protein A3D77_02855 [Candidatus Gottesmanbacteria bacterium RIFCSPHIGHO2_02_FULL_39_11]